MPLRSSQPKDNAAIVSLIKEAFGPEEGPEVSKLASDLLADPSAEPRISLVEDQDGQILGHVIFSHVQLSKEGNGTTPTASILAPLAVAPSRQKQGIGQSLITKGLELLRQQGVQVAIVYGDPNYYSRTGFHANHQISAPQPLKFPHGWLALELEPGTLDNLQAKLKCADCLNHPNYW